MAMTALPARRARDSATAAPSADAVPRPRARKGLRNRQLNRELSWIEFNERILELVAAESVIFKDVKKALATEGIEILGYSSIPQDHAALRQRFIDEIY